MSHHKWYTASGLMARTVFAIATSFESARLPCAVLYGLIEVLGLKDTLKAMSKLGIIEQIKSQVISQLSRSNKEKE